MKNNLRDFCIVHINSTQNNTILTASGVDNQVILSRVGDVDEWLDYLEVD